MRSSDKPELPSCPNCKASQTIRTHEQLGEELFFCPECEHTWSIRPGKPPRVSKDFKY